MRCNSRTGSPFSQRGSITTAQLYCIVNEATRFCGVAKEMMDGEEGHSRWVAVLLVFVRACGGNYTA